MDNREICEILESFKLQIERASSWSLNSQPSTLNCLSTLSTQLFLELNPECAGSADGRKVAFIEELTVFIGFQEVLDLFVVAAANEILQLLEVLGPADSVKEFRPRKLGFVQCVFEIARAEIKIAKAAFGKLGVGRSHHAHTQVAVIIF